MHLTFARAVAMASAAAVAAIAAPGLTQPVSVQPEYLTYHFDNARTGWNPHESMLTASAVASKRFGLIRVLPSDSVVYAQPLYVKGIRTARGVHDLVIVANEADRVYAYDPSSGALVWHRDFTDWAAGVTPQDRMTVDDCNQIAPTIGISSTPVVDRKTQTLYVVDKLQTNKGMTITWRHELRALDLRTGLDRQAPAVISGSVRNADGTTTTFADQHQQNRPGLVLANGTVYIAFGSSCDETAGTVHGWMFGYDARSLGKIATFATTSSTLNSYLGSVWQSTYAPAADAAGNLYFSTGNGSFDADKGGHDYGDAVLRLNRDLGVVDYFAPSNDQVLNNTDQDVASNGVMLVPDTAGRRLAIAGAKNGVLYLLDRDSLGHFASPDRALQEITLEDAPNSLYGGAAYYPGYVYWGAGMQPMQQFALTTSPAPRLTARAHTPNAFPGEGGEIPAVSSNGTSDGSAVV